MTRAKETAEIISGWEPHEDTHTPDPLVPCALLQAHTHCYRTHSIQASLASLVATHLPALRTHARLIHPNGMPTAVKPQPT